MQLRDEYAEATEITGNIFNVAPKTYAAVMNLRQLEGTAEAPVVIANNVINLTSLNASYSAFKLNGSKINNVNIAHNTFRMRTVVLPSGSHQNLMKVMAISMW